MRFDFLIGFADMPFFTYHDKLVDAQPLQQLDLDKAGIAEFELRDLLAQHLPQLDQQAELMVIAREYSSWSDATRRIDVLAIDADARLVVVELKRTKDGGHAELQALRYAAMLSTHTFGNVVNALVEERRKTDKQASRDLAESDLLLFLGKTHADEVKLGSMPRIMLIAQGFSTEITTTVMWLLEHMKIDISCYTVTLFPYGEGGKALHFDLLLPLPQQADYLVKVRDKNDQEAQQLKVSVQRRQRACTILEEKNLLKPGDPLELLCLPRAGMELANPGQRQAIYLGGGKVQWTYDQTEYSSLSKLTALICSEFGEPVKAIQGTAYWGNAKGTLSDQAEKLG